MPNLRDRLKRIKETKTLTPDVKEQQFDTSSLEKLGWVCCGFMALKREVTVPSPLKAKKKIPSSLSVIIPDLIGHKNISTGNFLFFDLETTGLSGGAGTVAFLAAFGRIISGSLKITQYLLLDYPGQNDFLENVIKKLSEEKSIIVSYNGKCFDSKIINTMCIMNRIKPPVYAHADLLYPSRRLWKNLIHDCSQGSVERNILGINRVDDIPGAMAPDIWFDFLKTGETERLMGICNHNIYDISGLAGIIEAVISIVKDPYDCKYKFDIERYALYWRHFFRKNVSFCDKKLVKTSENLLKFAAENNYKKAVYWYSFDQFKLGNYDVALKFINKGLKLFDKESEWHEKLLRRKERVLKRI